MTDTVWTQITASTRRQHRILSLVSPDQQLLADKVECTSQRYHQKTCSDSSSVVAWVVVLAVLLVRITPRGQERRMGRLRALFINFDILMCNLNADHSSFT